MYAHMHACMHARSSSLTCLTLTVLEKLCHSFLTRMIKSQADQPLSFSSGCWESHGRVCTGVLCLTFNIWVQYTENVPNLALYPLFSEPARAI